jgi:hypothetical protein
VQVRDQDWLKQGRCQSGAKLLELFRAKFRWRQPAQLRCHPLWRRPYGSHSEIVLPGGQKRGLVLSKGQICQKNKIRNLHGTTMPKLFSPSSALATALKS